MNIHTAFPSKWVREADLLNRDVTVQISSVQIQNLAGEGQDEELKPVVYFTGREKGLGLNKTNANTIEDMFGAETDDWIGKWIVLHPDETDFGGKRVPCIRIRLKPGEEAAAISEDDIPF